MSQNPPSFAPSILLGMLDGVFLRLYGQQSVFLAAPTRSGKGVAVVIPNLLAWPDSLICLDIKEENAELTAGYRAAYGQQVCSWRPFADDDRSHGINPLTYVRPGYRYAVTDTLDIGHILYPEKPDAGELAHFFAGHARNLFLAWVLFLMATPQLPLTIGEIQRQASGKGMDPADYIRGLLRAREGTADPLPDTCIDTFQRFLSLPENTSGGIIGTLLAPLTVFTDPMVDAATSRDDVDLRDLRKKRISLYLRIPPAKLDQAGVLINLIYSLALKVNTNELPSKNPALKYQILLVNDEASAPGRIPIFAKAFGWMAGYGIRVITIVQSLGQLESAYGEKDALTLVTNHAVQIIFPPREQRDAQAYSEMLDYFTEKSESRGRSTNYGARGGGSSRSMNESPQKRPLMLPEEIKFMGRGKQIVLMENVRPIYCNRIKYFEDETFKSRLLPEPPIPRIDLDRHRAVVERRARAVDPDAEDFSIASIVADLSRLPVLQEGAAAPELSAFVSQFFEALASTPAAVPWKAPPKKEKAENDDDGDSGAMSRLVLSLGAMPGFSQPESTMQ